MTALKKYRRLESRGVWRAGPAEQRRDVVVAMGDATLTISDMRDQALAHWSLPAIERLNPGGRPAIYRPGPDSPEELELVDDTMIRGIDRVLAAIERRRPHPGRLRQRLIVALCLAVAAGAALRLPGAMVRHAAKVLPEAARARIGQDLLADIRRVAGAPCDATLGRRALARLGQRVLGPGGGEIVVMSGGVEAAEHLPGGITLLNRSLVENHEGPEVAAGHLLAEDLRRRMLDPAERLLRDRGVVTAFRLLTTGAIPQPALDAHAEALLTTPPAPVSDEALLARFAEAGIPSAPYAYALDITGESTLKMIEASPVAPGAAAPLLSDDDWIALQGICSE